MNRATHGTYPHLASHIVKARLARTCPSIAGRCGLGHTAQVRRYEGPLLLWASLGAVTLSAQPAFRQATLRLYIKLLGTRARSTVQTSKRAMFRYCGVPWDLPKRATCGTHGVRRVVEKALGRGEGSGLQVSVTFCSPATRRYSRVTRCCLQELRLPVQANSN
jgi:hypothetical protein